ncbi:MAG: MFS transporter [Armatimonadota bacterium]
MNVRDTCKWLVEGFSAYRQTFMVGLAASAAHLGYGVLNQSAIPPYVVMLGWTGYIGIIYAAWLIAETLSKAPMGTLADRVGVRPMYVSAAIIGAFSAYLWTVVRNIWVILGIRVLDGISSAGIWTITIVAMSETVPTERRTTAMGAFTLTYLVGLSLGPLFGGFSNDITHSKETSFYVASLLFMLTAVLVYFIVPKKRESGTAASDGGLKLPFLTQMRIGLKAFPDFMLIAAVVFFSFGMLIPVVKLFAMQELGMSEFGYGLLVLPVALILAVATLAAGRLAGIWGKVNSVYIGIGIAAAAMYFVPVIHEPWHLAVLATIIGSGFVIGMPAWLALVADMSAEEVRGAVIGAIGTGEGAGIILGVALGGFLYVNVPVHFFRINLDSHYTPFIASAIGLTICLFLAMHYIREDRKRYVTLEDV